MLVRMMIAVRSDWAHVREIEGVFMGAGTLKVIVSVPSEGDAAGGEEREGERERESVCVCA